MTSPRMPPPLPQFISRPCDLCGENREVGATGPETTIETPTGYILRLCGACSKSPAGATLYQAFIVERYDRPKE